MAILLLGAVLPGTAAAHGKEVGIAVTSWMPDPSQPLRRVYRAQVRYASDGDPVEGATVMLTARRADGTIGFPAQALTQIPGDGIYVGEVVFGRFGMWDMHLAVQARLGQGDGSVAFTDDIRPETLSADQEASRRAEGERVARLQLLFRFDWWPDGVSIVLRIVHALAGLAYFVVSALALSLAWLGVPSRFPDFARRLDHVFLPAALGSLAVLLAAGLYSAAFDAPVAFPGLYDIAAIRRIPYGDAYLLAFVVKVALFVGLVVLAFSTHRGLRRWASAPVGTAEPAEAAALRRTTLLTAVAGLAAVVDVAVLLYLHGLSHLGAFLPAS